MKKIIYVNNTGKEVSMFHFVFVNCVKNAKALPKEISDIFTLKIVNVNGADRGIVEFA
jgi:hypothetical protein